MNALAMACDGRDARVAWLRKAAAGGHLGAMHRLAAEVENPTVRRQWLLRAAQEGHVPAMHDLSEASDDPAERERWIAEAAKHGCEAARFVMVTAGATVDCLSFRSATASSGRRHPGWESATLADARRTVGWTSNLSSVREAIEVCIDPGEAAKETIQELLESLSDLHREAGGLGLEFSVDGLFVMAREEVPI